MDTLADLFAAAQAVDPARPFVTFYDDATGERVELSYASFGNWVAKTANLVQEGLAAEAGHTVALLLPLHWQTLVWLMACWEARVVAVPGGDPAETDHAVSGPDDLDALQDSPGERVALALRPLGGRFEPPHIKPLPEGVLDYAVEVPAYGDQALRMAGPPRPDDPAARLGGRTYTNAELVGHAREHAAARQLGEGARVLTDLDAGTLAGLAGSMLAPMAVRGSVVLCRYLDRDQVERRTAAERATHVLLRDT
jgi:uncharacterized protein (TIGR03089 family)